MNNDIKPPTTVRGMKTLDRSAFDTKIKVPGLVVPCVKIGILNKKLKASLLKIHKFSPIVGLAKDDPKYDTHRLFLLDPSKYRSTDDFSEEERTLLDSVDVDMYSFRLYDVDLTYNNWTVPDILRAVLPEDVDNVSAFTIVGHIAHVNLREAVLNYKKIIGEVILDKVPSVETVVNKTSNIENTYRVFPMELLAGKDDYVVKVRENGFTYEFDFTKVFWNSRLGTEHDRFVSQLREGDILYDVCCGVGPFAIPAAKKDVTVLANDLNPDCVYSMHKNIKLNKVKVDNIDCFNKDGREFIRTIVKTDICNRWKTSIENGRKTNFVLVMNLPGIAIEFLDAFRSLFWDVDSSITTSRWVSLPVIHCYCFTNSQDPEQDIKERILERIGEATLDDFKVRLVRDVAPGKNQMCATFTVPKTVLFCHMLESADGNQEQEEEASSAKRPRLSQEV